jgi:predicted extracellular nuclease
VKVRPHIFDADPGHHRIFSRDCLEVTVDVPHGANVTLLVNHLKSKGYGSPADNDKKRKAQADKVAEIVGNRATSERLIVLGDFNDTPNSAPLQGLLAVNGLTNVIEANVPNAADRWTYHYKNQKSQIDYLLASSKLNALEAGIERRGIFGVNGVQPFPSVTANTNAASDHAAVWADFDI